VNHEIQTVDPIDALAESLDPDTSISVGSGTAIAREEIICQLDAAHRYPRSVSRFLKESCGLATLTREVAESCMYSLPRAGKAIVGPSVRLAEIVASSYGNLQVGSRIVAVEEKEVVAQGLAWDIERNVRCVTEVRRRITNKFGKRYDDDMITVTGNAAASIALRNAIYRVVPRAYVDSIFEKVRKVAIGDATTLSATREKVLSRLLKMGVTQDRVLARLEIRGVDDITAEHLEALIGFGTAIKDGGTSVDEAFPPVAANPPPEQDGRRIKIGRRNGEPTAESSREPGSDDA
jgi:hypothetical protein